MSATAANRIIAGLDDAVHGRIGRVTFHLPQSPSVNNLFGNRRDGKGRYRTATYEAWITHAGHILNRARVPTFAGPVNIKMAFPEPKGRADLDGKPKAILDLLVRHEILPDDNNKHVRELHLKWCEPGDLCRIEIEAAA